MNRENSGNDFAPIPITAETHELDIEKGIPMEQRCKEVKTKRFPFRVGVFLCVVHYQPIIPFRITHSRQGSRSGSRLFTCEVGAEYWSRESAEKERNRGQGLEARSVTDSDNGFKQFYPHSSNIYLFLIDPSHPRSNSVFDAGFPHEREP
ncbi:hypothetical protein E3N88_30489 [Mikania micrantha]|uniref:Uncharacterized protein n=1 Tax=Mikania micrantha TaxID=192012 RepID=A0A5N6MLS7_9ASTR|nr:hypothetical protein E3N88_30489 [Mikania micrantha]